MYYNADFHSDGLRDSYQLERSTFFYKKKKNVASKFFSHPVEVTGSMYFGNLKEIGIIQLV